MARDAEEYGVEVSKASLANILNPHGENDVSESISIEELAKEVANLPDPEVDEDEAQEDTEVKLPGWTFQHDTLTLARAILESHGQLSEEASEALFKCQRAINAEKAHRMNQTTIEQHFTKK